jgi:hypothetical protein
MTTSERMDDIKFWWWLHVRRKFTLEALQWKLAWLLPRKVALLAFVRVYAASTSEAPHDEYARVYKAWEAGAGR